MPAAVGPKLRVAFVSAETEHCLVGGLAEVAKSLPAALQRKNVAVTRFAPLHPSVWSAVESRLQKVRFRDKPEAFLGGERMAVSAYKLQDSAVPTVYFTDSRDSRFFTGSVYQRGTDLGEKFFFSTLAVLELIRSGQFGEFDVIHFQDWHFSLIPTLIKYNPRYRSLARMAAVGTVHNVYSWGMSPSAFEALSGLSQKDYPMLYGRLEGLLHRDEVHFLKGFQDADMANTVSPRYARELQSPETGWGFDDLFRRLYDDDRFVGILNGIGGGWNPSSDKLIASRFSADDYSGKTSCKEDLRREFGLSDHSESPVIAALSRIAVEKGFDILIPSIAFLVNSGAQFVFYGAGESALFDQLIRISGQFPGKVAVRRGNEDERLPHLVYAGSDVFCRPSVSEPCGLSHMIGMKYGAVPVVHKTGGLADTVTDIDENALVGNGFAFDGYSPEVLQERMRRALHIFRREPFVWQSMMMRCMRGDYSWERSVDLYVILYRRAIENARKRTEG